MAPGQKIVMLEPRRLAARTAAQRMAETLGEEVGQTVGYTVRLERRVSARTRIEVVTEGILTRRLQSDPELAGTGLVIFDEFHERSLDADLGLALTLDIQRGLRDDLRSSSCRPRSMPRASRPTWAMPRSSMRRAASSRRNALPRQGPAPDHFGRCRCAPSTARWTKRTRAFSSSFPAKPRSAARRMRSCSGLPKNTVVRPLYGAMSFAEQDAAIRPSPPGERKIVLATTIAETSLTIDGIGAVIDTGFKRVPRFDPASGMTALETVRVSLASADQRRGRAGRLGPGIGYRLWPEAETRALAPHDEPEIFVADLAPLVLELAAWGVTEPKSLPWLDPPPAAPSPRRRTC